MNVATSSPNASQPAPADEATGAGTTMTGAANKPTMAEATGNGCCSSAVRNTCCQTAAKPGCCGAAEDSCACR
jgi:hypothetical protein